MKTISKTNIEAILFDFGGTLDSDGYDWPARFYQLITKRVGDIEFKEFVGYVRTAADAMTSMADTITLDMDATAARLCAGIHEQMPNGWSVDDVTEEFIMTARGYLKRNEKLLAELAKHYKLGCVSNNWGNVAFWCKQYNVAQYFDTIIDSALVKSVKPESKIFNAGLKGLNISADSCAYVGDNFQCDVVGSYNAGMKPVWIKSPQACIKTGGCFVDGKNKIDPAKINPIEIMSLTELLKSLRG